MATRKPTPFAESEKQALLAVVDRIKLADAKNQASRSPLKAVPQEDIDFQKDSNLPIEFFDYFKIDRVA